MEGASLGGGSKAVGNSVMLHPAPDTTENHGSVSSVPMHNESTSNEELAGVPPGGWIC